MHYPLSTSLVFACALFACMPGISLVYLSSCRARASLRRRYIRAAVEPPSSGRRNLTTVGLIEALGVSSERGVVLDFGEYMAAHGAPLPRPPTAPAMTEPNRSRL